MENLTRNQAEELAIQKIQELTEDRFNILGQMLRSEKWDYVGSMSKHNADEAYWMRFKDNEFTMITCDSYGEGRYSLIQKTVMDLDVLKRYVESVISFGDGTSNGTFDPNTDIGLAAIIESIAHSLPAHGGENEVLENTDLSKYDEYLDPECSIEIIDYEKALNDQFKKIADIYDIPFDV